jgi:far upstream element-binding protein
MSSISPEEAVARAKAIAAKLSGGGAADTNSTVTVPANGTLDPNAIALAAQAALESALGGGGSKRKRWGVPGDDTNDSSKKLKEATHSKRIWVSTETKPPSHFAAYFAMYPTDLDAILSQAPGVTIELKGRGSHSSTVLPGMPEEPMHIMIEGDDIEAVTLAESLMEGLMNKMIQHELLVDEHAVANDGYSDLALTGHAVTMLEEQIGIPNGVVGFIIGRGGESITSMQARTGCKVQMQKEHDMAPGAQMRVITLQATTKEAIDACREIIQGMVQERIKTTHSSSTFGQAAPPVNPQDSKLQEALQAGHVLVEIKVPDTDVGLIIGKSGVTIRGIQDRSGANIQIPQSGDPDDPRVRTVSITHAHAEGAALARQLIDDLLSTKKEHVPFLNMQVEVRLLWVECVFSRPVFCTLTV